MKRVVWLFEEGDVVLSLVFLQWMDWYVFCREWCGFALRYLFLLFSVWQVTQQFPESFEFNEAFLIAIADQLRSGWYVVSMCRRRHIHPTLIYTLLLLHIFI